MWESCYCFRAHSKQNTLQQRVHISSSHDGECEDPRKVSFSQVVQTYYNSLVKQWRESRRISSLHNFLFSKINSVYTALDIKLPLPLGRTQNSLQLYGKELECLIFQAPVLSKHPLIAWLSSVSPRVSTFNYATTNYLQFSPIHLHGHFPCHSTFRNQCT